MKYSILPPICLILGWSPGCVRSQGGATARFDILVERMEANVLKFAKKVEELHVNRCEFNIARKCTGANYDNCKSRYPNPTCEATEGIASSCFIPDDTQDTEFSCSTLIDYTQSTVRLSGSVATSVDNNPLDDKVIESVCYTQELDEYFIEERELEAPFWMDYGLKPPQMYFGSTNGAFRIYPARQSTNCTWFDARIRDWYVAGSSGSKNVVMILDTSGSMKNGRLELMQEAAKQIVQTLTPSDRVAIVSFADFATVKADKDLYLFEATAVNKNLLVNYIDSLVIGGGTNFLDSFESAFKVMSDSIDMEIHVSCNTAFLFLTDGQTEIPAEATEDQIIEVVSQGLANIGNRISGGRPLLFTYSISENDDVHTFPRRLACSATNYGVWSKIVDTRKIVESLTSYYQLFAFGLGSEKNIEFTAWVEPYTFDSSDTLGVSVSAPVYDRSVDPPVFIGVAAMDILLSAVEKALQAGPDEAIRRIVQASTAKCPSLELDVCALEAFRSQGTAQDESLCTSNCTNLVDTKPQTCSDVSDYPSNIFVPTRHTDDSYINRTCCQVGFQGVSQQCIAQYEEWKQPITMPPTPSPVSDLEPSEKSKSPVVWIGGIVAGAILCLCVVALLLFFRKRKKDPKECIPPSGIIEAFAVVIPNSSPQDYSERSGANSSSGGDRTYSHTASEAADIGVPQYKDQVNFVEEGVPQIHSVSASAKDSTDQDPCTANSVASSSGFADQHRSVPKTEASFGTSAVSETKSDS